MGWPLWESQWGERGRGKAAGRPVQLYLRKVFLQLEEGREGRALGGSKGAVHPTGTVLGAGDSKVNKRDRVGPSQSSHSAVGRERLTCSK